MSNAGKPRRRPPEILRKGGVHDKPSRRDRREQARAEEDDEHGRDDAGKGRDGLPEHDR